MTLSNVIELTTLMSFIGLTANRLAPVILGTYTNTAGKDLVPAVLSVILALLITQVPDVAREFGLYLPALHGTHFTGTEQLIVIMGAWPTTKLWFELQKAIRRGELDKDALVKDIDRWIGQIDADE